MNTDTRKTFWERLVEALEARGRPTTGNGVAGMLKMSQGSVNRWQRNEGLPELDTVRELALDTGVCVEWLLTGRGTKKPLKMDEETDELLSVWVKLQENGRHAVRIAAHGAFALQQQSQPAIFSKNTEKV